MKKSTKSQQVGLTPPSLRTTGGVHELVARAMRGKCVRQRINRKSAVLLSPKSHTTTRANISHEEAEQIRARIVCTPAYKGAAGVNLICSLTGWRVHFCFLLLALLGLYLVWELTHMRSMCVGVAETGVGASTTRTIHNATFLLSRF